MQMGLLLGAIRALATVINSESLSDAGRTWPGQGDAGGSRHEISGAKVQASTHQITGCFMIHPLVSMLCFILHCKSIYEMGVGLVQ